MEQKASWFFHLCRDPRAKTDTAPVPKRDPAGLRFPSFRMEYFRPVWRYKVKGKPRLEKRGVPSRGCSIPAEDPKTITDFRGQSADIVTLA